MKTPIFDNRTIVGYASSIESAKRVIKKLIHVDARAKLHVFLRNTEIIDLPAGFVYSISWGTK